MKKFLHQKMKILKNRKNQVGEVNSLTSQKGGKNEYIIYI